ncbi:conjugal transfer protein TraR [Pseudomonas donghuensis]|nr:conjugal transfer protein TraR [Pseudomonas donghuensis]
MADIADIGNDRAQWHLDMALAAHKAVPLKASLKDCIDCDDPISEARRLAATGCTRCAECQELSEKMGARYAG